MSDIASPESITVTDDQTGRTVLVGLGQEVTFGRGTASDIRLAQDDPAVSRAAGAVECRLGGALVHNRSRTNDLVLQPVPGVEQTVPPEVTVGTSSVRFFRVVLRGTGQAHYRISVNQASVLRPPAPVSSASKEGETVGYRYLEWLTPTERLYLCAISEPLLLRSGSAAVARNYKEAAERLTAGGRDRKETTVRNTLNRLRERLAADEGLIWLRYEDGDPRGGRLLDRLATWAVRSGNVTLSHLEDLDVDEVE